MAGISVLKRSVCQTEAVPSRDTASGRKEMPQSLNTKHLTPIVRAPNTLGHDLL